MAKFEGIFEIKGTLQGMSFYKTKNGLLIRKKGGVEKGRIMSDPNFQRTRENLSEFGHNAHIGQLLRKSIASLLPLAKDSRVGNRLMQVVNKVKNLDMDSSRGERRFWIGLESDAGKLALRGFDFNINAAFHKVFRSVYSLDPVTGIVTIDELNPALHLSIPAGATHASFQVAVSNVDFEMENYGSKYSEIVTFELTDSLQNFTLDPMGLPGGSGITLYYFMISFYQNLNNFNYPLKNNSHNVLYLMEVKQL